MFFLKDILHNSFAHYYPDVHAVLVSASHFISSRHCETNNSDLHQVALCNLHNLLPITNDSLFDLLVLTCSDPPIRGQIWKSLLLVSDTTWNC